MPSDIELVDAIQLGDTRRELEEGFNELRWRAFRQDPALFFREAVWIPSQESDTGKTKFDLYDYQEADLDTFLDNKFVVTLKSRQIGMSTLVAGLSLWRCLFWPGTVILAISNNQDNANEFLGAIKVMWQNLPAWTKAKAPERTSNQASRQEWTFSGGMRSYIRSMAGTATAGASETASVVILDEFALVDDHIQDDLFRSTEPTTNAGGQLWMLSTARGGHNRFAQTYQRAKRGEGRFAPIFHPWMVSRFINPNARLLQDCPECRGTGLLQADPDGEHLYCGRCVDTSTFDKIREEYADKPHLLASDYPATAEEAFRESGNPRFLGMLPDDRELADYWVKGEIEEDSEGRRWFQADPASDLRVREDIAYMDNPPDEDYVLFTDPAKGHGGDYISAHIVRYDDQGEIEIVAWYHDNQTEPAHVAQLLDPLGRWFHNALFVVETTGGWGASMISELKNHLYYPSLYAHRGSDKVKKGKRSKYGFPMSWQKRPLVVDRLAKLLAAEQIHGIYEILKRELSTFVMTDQGRLEADTGCHDDTVLSLAGACWVLTEVYDPEEDEEEDEEDPEWGRGDLSRLFERIEQAREAKAAAAQKFERRVERASRRQHRQSGRRGHSTIW